MVQGLIFFWVWTQIGGGNMAFVRPDRPVLLRDDHGGAFGLLATIPAQFVGAAVFFGNLGLHKGDLVETIVHTAVCMLIGNLAGLLSAKLPTWFQSQKATAPA